MGCGGSKSASGPGKGSAKNKSQAEEQNANFQDTMLFAEKVPLFRRLPKDRLPILAAACVPITFKPGQEIIKEGDEGQEFFTIKDGEATVMVGHKKVATLKCGDYFGESALIHDEPRTATVVALTRLNALKITREKFQDLGLTDELHFANRKAVGDGETAGGKKVETKPPSEKTEADRAEMEKALESNPNLKTLRLDKAMVQQIIDVAWQEDVKVGEKLISQGDANADYFYVVKDGAFDISVKSDKGEEKQVARVAKGGSFGELALLYLAPRAATVECKKTGCVWVIDRHNFKQILVKKSQDKVMETAGYLDRVEILAPLTSEEKNKLACALTEVRFKKDQIILNQGDAGSAFYLLFEGSVVVIKDGQEQAKLEACNSKETVQVFGERALLNSEKRAATVKVVSATAKAFALDRDDFNVLLGPLKDLLAGGKEEASKAGKKGAAKKGATKEVGAKKKTSVKAKAAPPRVKITRQELNIKGLLGCGGFGAVELAEHKETGESFALKAVSKGYIVQTGMKESIMNEKNILSMTNSVFIVKLFETYNDEQNVYFLLELALGGELYATYNRKGLHGKEVCAKFYSAGVVFSFDHCHTRHIIYRDLKPENLLLTDTGRIKLTDMGLSKFVVGVTYTTCGTPDYFSPELISSSGHTVAVDWWCLGILIYELMSGNPPFESEHPMQTYSKVMQGIEKVNMHPKCKKEPVNSIIKGFLRPDPSDRLGMLPGKMKTIQDQEWYNGFDWEAMEKQEMEVPYKPVVASKTDMKNFHARKEDMPPQIFYKDDGSGWDKDFASAN